MVSPYGTHTCTPTSTHMHTHAHAHIQVHACTRAHIQYTHAHTSTPSSHAHIQVHACAHAHRQAHICTRTHMHTHVHSHTCTHTSTHMHIYTHVHIQAHACTHTPPRLPTTCLCWGKPYGMGWTPEAGSASGRGCRTFLATHSQLPTTPRLPLFCEVASAGGPMAWHLRMGGHALSRQSLALHTSLPRCPSWLRLHRACPPGGKA